MKEAKEKIKEAFLHYLHEKPYDKIKVSELIRAAEVNRSTFYRYYEDVIALYHELCEETAKEYISALPPFTCGVVCSLVYYYATLDRDAFFKRMELLYSIPLDRGHLADREGCRE